jgi:hypothetical protein
VGRPHLRSGAFALVKLVCSGVSYDVSLVERPGLYRYELNFSLHFVQVPTETSCLVSWGACAGSSKGQARWGSSGRSS